MVAFVNQYNMPVVEVALVVSVSGSYSKSYGGSPRIVMKSCKSPALLSL